MPDYEKEITELKLEISILKTRIQTLEEQMVRAERLVNYLLRYVPKEGE